MIAKDSWMYEVVHVIAMAFLGVQVIIMLRSAGVTGMRWEFMGAVGIVILYYLLLVYLHLYPTRWVE